MVILQLLAVLGISCTVFAGECKTPPPVEGFSMEKLAGAWTYAIIEASRDEEIKRYEHTNCATLQLDLDNGVGQTNKWHVDMKLGEADGHQNGTYVVPDPSKGFLKLFSKTLNKTYDITVLCTDYTAWMVLYVCLHVEPDVVGDHIVVLSRDALSVNNVLSLTSLPNCIRGLTSKAVTDMRIIPHVGCLLESAKKEFGGRVKKLFG